MDFSAAPQVLLFVITMAASLSSSVINAHFSHHAGGNACNFYLYSAASSVVSAVAIFLLMGMKLQFSLFSVLLGVAFGLAICFQQVTLSAALTRGPLSYTQVITSMATLLPTLAGMIFWQEEPRLAQGLGICMMVVCLVLSVKKEQDARRATRSWFLFAILSCVLNGAIGIMQKVHQTSTHKNELAAFLVVAFVVSCLFSGLMLLALYLKNRGGDQPSRPTAVFRLPVLLGFFALAGICTAACHCINLHLSGVIPAFVFFPIVNGGGLMLVTLASFFLFKERLTARQWVGLASGAAATLLLCL